MCSKLICFIFFYAIKSASIFSWILRSLFLLHQRQDFTSIWNLFTSILLLFLDCLFHASYLTQNCSTTLYRILLGLFFIGIGPVLLILSLLGSVNDSLDYTDLFCEEGCVSNKQTLSIIARDFHLALLIILSIFGLASGIIYCFISLNTQPSELEASLLQFSTYSARLCQEINECSICKDLIMPGEAIIVIDLCQHSYHNDCIQNWFLFKSECPLCRAKIITNRLN